jgi:glycosyltransferase involved in cell wall biosynthesis
MSSIYVSNGNIPSRWAHTFQVMKMAEAYAQILEDFRILVNGHAAERLLPMPDLREFYGLGRELEIVKLRTQWFRLHSTYRKVSAPRKYLAAAIEYLHRHKPEMVFTRSYHVAEAVIAQGLPLIFETHGGPDHQHMGKVEKIAKAPNLHGLVTTLEYLKKGYEALGVPSEKILVVGNGVDLDRYEALDVDPMTLRRELRLAIDRPVVMYTGHLYEHKGVRTLLEAARHLPECDVVLVGGWPRDVARWRKEYESHGNVIFTGFVPNIELARYITAADICVVTHLAGDRSAPETCPLKLFEYMAAARPIVISDFEAIRSIIRHDENGILVESGNVDALAQAVQRLRAEPALAKALGDRAREDVRTRTWDQRAARVVATFAPGLLRD